MRDTSALVAAIQENFHLIIALPPEEKRRLIDEIWEYEEQLQCVAREMAQ